MSVESNPTMDTDYCSAALRPLQTAGHR